MTAPTRATLINPMARHLDAIGGPIRITHAEGVRLYDDTGRSWIDCETGTGVFSLGHRHPKIVHTLRESIDEYDLGNHHLISEARAKLAHALSLEISLACSSIFPYQMETYRHIGWTDERLRHLTRTLESIPECVRCVFNASAGESVDCAIKLARGVVGKAAIVCADCSYHGSTGNALAASASSLAKGLPANSSGFVHVPYGPVDAIAHELERRTDIAAVLLEPIAIEAGCVVSPDGYMQSVRELCHEKGALLIVDESVTGLGRTGSVLACAQQGAVPDILVVGHALGGGAYPMYATCHREELDEFYVENPFVHISTFGGGEVGCSAAAKALSELTEGWLLDNVNTRGAEFRAALSSLQRRSGTLVRSVRGVGLAIAVELRDTRTASAVQRNLFEAGVLCRPALLAPHTLLFLPPLGINADEMATVISAVGTVFSKASET